MMLRLFLLHRSVLIYCQIEIIHTFLENEMIQTPKMQRKHYILGCVSIETMLTRYGELI